MNRWSEHLSRYMTWGLNINLRSWPVTHCMLYSKPDINCDIHLRTYLARNFCNVSSNNPILKTTATSSKLNAAIKMIFLFCYRNIMFVQLLLVIVLLTYFAEKREANLVFSLYAICSTLEKTFQQIIPILKNKNQCVIIYVLYFSK